MSRSTKTLTNISIFSYCFEILENFICVISNNKCARNWEIFFARRIVICAHFLDFLSYPLRNKIDRKRNTILIVSPIRPIAIRNSDRAPNYLYYLFSLRSRQREDRSENTGSGEVIAQIRGSCHSHVRFAGSWEKPNRTESCS